jgi:ABC-type multidrug transport system fused ATPase/permease subunit
MKPSQFIFYLVRQYPLHLLGNISVLLVANFIAVASLMAIAPIVDFLVNGDGVDHSAITQEILHLLQMLDLPATLYSCLAVLLALYIVKNGLLIISEYMFVRTKFAILWHVKTDSYKHIFGANWYFFSSTNQGTFLNTFLREAGNVGDAFGVLSRIFVSSMQALFYFAVPFFLFWKLASITLFVVVLLVLPFLLLGKINYRLGQQNIEKGNIEASYLQEAFNCAKIILGFGLQEQTLAKLASAFNAHRRVSMKSQVLERSTPLLYEPIGMGVILLTLVLSQKFVIPLSDIAVGLWALRNAIPMVGVLASQRNRLINLLPSYEQIQRLTKEAEDARQRSGSVPFTGYDQKIIVEDLTFSYPNNEPCLANISLEIEKGQMIALVGPSGAGKSTLVDLIMGFHVPLEGDISIDGRPLYDFDITSFRQRIGFVPQDSILFNSTIGENLCWAHMDASEEEIETACRLANVEEFILSLPQGYDTVVGDRGVRLSGGQRQRIALARAILRQPDILVLDEATSALDSQSEKMIQAAIEEIAGDTTIIAIAHRLSTIINADMVYVMKAGEIVERGTYSELRDLGGHFSDMAKLQVLALVD